jgi:hypothetical protein
VNSPRTCRFLIVLTTACVVAPAFADVELEAEQRESLGIQTEPARAIEAPRSWPASAQVLDSAPLITALGELRSAETAVAASRAEAERSEKLYREETNIARKTLDAARAQAIADEARLNTARAALLGTWGRTIATMPGAQRAKLIDDLLSGRVSLVRAEQLQPLPADASVGAVHVVTLDSHGEWNAEWLGTLPQTTNPTLAGSSLLRVPAALSVGQLLEATLTEKRASLHGMSVPAAAVVRYRGAEWVYEEGPKNHFTRSEVRAGTRVQGRALLAGATKAPPQVVTVGARSLLGAELGASEPGDDEADAGE